MTKNPASGRVMQKIGMKYEGTLRQSILRWEKFEDAAMYSILRNEFVG
jgi:[ribosomal protein S5]-alanine N-acetyltransferase